jgi:hypothetical protein
VGVNVAGGRGGGISVFVGVRVGRGVTTGVLVDAGGAKVAVCVGGRSVNVAVIVGSGVEVGLSVLVGRDVLVSVAGGIAVGDWETGGRAVTAGVRVGWDSGVLVCPMAMEMAVAVGISQYLPVMIVSTGMGVPSRA